MTEIYKGDAAKYPLLALDILSDIKAKTRVMLHLCWTLRNPIIYVVLSRNIIILFLLLFLVSIPMWYLFGGSQPAPQVKHSILERSIEDTEMLRLVLVAPGRSLPDKIFSVASFLWNALLSVPVLLLLPAAIIAALRKRFRASGAFAPLRKYEIMFRAIASDLQRALPQSMRGPLFMVEFAMTGDINTAIGQGINFTVRSAHINYGTIQGQYEKDVDEFLKTVADEIDKSKNPAAQALFTSLTSGLKQPDTDKRTLKGLWDGLMKILPSIGEIAGASEAIVKLFGL